MATIAILSNPNSTGNISLLPAIRNYCADRADIFHYEVTDIDEVGAAMRMIARVRPKVLVINGGDGTVQSALTEMYINGHFGANPPPLAVLPNGLTNLIAADLGSENDPIAALDNIVTMTKGDLASHIVKRELISLSHGEPDEKPVLGMFLGGAGLAETIFYHRRKVHPLGLPNGISHFITMLAVMASTTFRLRANFLPPIPRPVRVSLMKKGQRQGDYALLIVTTLDKLLLGGRSGPAKRGQLKIVTVDHRPWALFRAIFDSFVGRFGRSAIKGVNIDEDEVIHISGDKGSVLLDGETFESSDAHPITLRKTPPVSFLSLAA